MDRAVGDLGEKQFGSGTVFAAEGQDVAIEFEIDSFAAALCHVGAILLSQGSFEDTPETDRGGEVEVDHGVAGRESGLHGAAVVAVYDPAGFRGNPVMSFSELHLVEFLPTR